MVLKEIVFIGWRPKFMNFNSFEFICFFLLFITTWNCIKEIWMRKLVLSLASVIFYSYSAGMIIVVLIWSISVDYFVAKNLVKSSFKKSWLSLSVVSNIGVLAYFKYSFQGDFPIGLSFFIFQSLSYTFDVYYKRIQQANSYLHYFSFVSMFPQLVSGPICRADDLLPQIEKKDCKQDWERGVMLIVQGYFKKTVLADYFGIEIYHLTAHKLKFLGTYDAWLLMAGFGWQIYFDFSGYTDIARGIGKCMGYEFPKNFNFPYLANSLQSFWSRWHITLSTWFRDYVYIPLGGSREGTSRHFCSIMVTMLLSGIWHGGTWNFLYWGMFHGLFLAIEKLVLNDEHLEKIPSWLTFINLIRTYFLVTFSWVFFKFDDIQDLKQMIYKMFYLQKARGSLLEISHLELLIMAALIFEGIQFYLKEKNNLVWIFVLLTIVLFFRSAPQEFIYYRF